MRRNLPLALISALLGFLLGAGAMFWGLRASPETARAVLGIKNERRTLGLSDFFDSGTFADLERMREEMQRGLGTDEALEEGSADAEIIRKDGPGFISYEVRGVDGSSLHTKVEGGYLVVSGEVKKESGQGTAFSSVLVSTFQRMLPLPPEADSSKLEILNEADKIILRFPRR